MKELCHLFNTGHQGNSQANPRLAGVPSVTPPGDCVENHTRLKQPEARLCTFLPAGMDLERIAKFVVS